MNKIKLGLLLGIAAGVIDVAPMIMMKLPLSADLSAFSMWVIIGFFIAATNIGIKGAVKGIVISFLNLLPAAIIISAGNPMDIIPVVSMTLVLGSLLGFFIEREEN